MGSNTAERTLAFTIDPRVCTLIDAAQHAIEVAKQVMEDMPQTQQSNWTACPGGYQQPA